MMNRTNILWGMLLGCSLLCLGMRPRPVTAEPVPQRSKVKTQAQSWKSRVFIRLQRDSTGQYAIYDYCQSSIPSYRIEGKHLVHNWGQEQERFLISRHERRGADHVFVTSSEGEPQATSSFRFTPLDSLGLLWRIEGEPFIDSLYADRVPLRHHPCPHDPEQEDAVCGRAPQEPAPQGRALKVLNQDWKEKTFLNVYWGNRGRYVYEERADLPPMSYRIHGDLLIRSVEGRADTAVIQRSYPVGGTRILSTFITKGGRSEQRVYRITSRDTLGVIWEIEGGRYVDSLHLDKIHVKR